MFVCILIPRFGCGIFQELKDRYKNVQNAYMRGALRKEHRGKSYPGRLGAAPEGLGAMVFIDLRDRYGVTQLAFNEKSAAGLMEAAKKLGREYVVQAEGTVIERASKNPSNPTGEVELSSKSSRCSTNPKCLRLPSRTNRTEEMTCV